MNDRIDVDFAFTAINTYGLFCAREGVNSKSWCICFLKNGNTVNRRLDYNGRQRVFQSSRAFRLGERYRLTLENKTMRTSSGDGCNADTNDDVPPVLSEAGDVLAIFAYYSNGAGNGVASQSTQRLYRFSVRRSGRLIHDWVPVRTAGGVATMCDLMTGNTITPSGSGAFIAGPELADFDVFVSDQAWDGEPRHAPRPFVAATNRTTGVALEPGRDYTVAYTNNAAEGWARAIVTGTPGSAYAGQGADADFRVIRALTNGYERLEYVEGDFATALKTGYVPKPSTDTLTLDFKMRDVQGSLGVLCARAGGYNAAWSLCWEGGNHLRFDCDNCQSNWTFGTVYNGDSRHKIKMANKTATADCASSMTAASAPATAGGTMMMMAYYGNPNNQVPASCAAMRIYGCQVVRSGTLIHDWVPVRTPEGVVTLYDRVTDTTPEFAGTGKLLAGPSWAHEGPVVFPKGTLMIFR